MHIMVGRNSHFFLGNLIYSEILLLLIPLGLNCQYLLKVLVILPKISYILVILLLLLSFIFIFYYIIFYLYYSVQSPFENCLLFVIIVFFHTSDEVISIDDGTFSWAENQPAILKKWVLVLFKIEFGISSSSGMMLCRAAPIKLVDGQWTFDD